MLRINYDIRNLGYAHGRSALGTGIGRLTENLLLQLLDNSEIDLSLSSAAPYSVLYDTLSYIKSNPRLKAIGVPLTNKDRIGIFFEAQGHFFSSIQNEFLKRATYKLIMTVQNHLNSSPTLSRRRLSQSDIYHATFFPIPDLVRRSKIKKIITIYDLIPVKHPEFFSPRMTQIFKKSIPLIDPDTSVICISESTKSDLLEYKKDLLPSQVTVIYPGASKDFYPCPNLKMIAQVKEKYGLSKDSKYFLSLATLEPRKNLDRLIRCFLRFVEETSSEDYYLILVGGEGWDFSRIYEAAKGNSKWMGRVIFTGFIPDEDLPPLCSGAMVFVYLSVYEGFGLPVLEAMQCGAPVMVSNNSSLPEVVGKAGIMVEAKNDDDIVGNFAKICEDRALRSDLSKRALERASMFSWEKCAQGTVDFYKKVAKR